MWCICESNALFISVLSNPSILKSWTKRVVRGWQGTLTSYSSNICTHTQSYIMHISPCWHRNSRPHSSSCSQSYEKMHDTPFFSFLLHSVQFFFPSSVVHMWTRIDLGPTAGSLKISALFFFFLLRWFIWGWSECSGVFSLFHVLSFLSFSGVVLHLPSILQARIRAHPYILVSSCAAWTFGGWKCQSSPHQVCVEETSPPPTPPSTIQRREMNGNKIFSCHHPCAGNPILS